MPGRETTGGDGYRYGFNGKEDDKSWGTQNIQDYGFRLYNPSIGKFLSVDPLSAAYPWYTPYQFSGNSPIRFIDLDGLEEFDPFSSIKYQAGVLSGVGKGGVDILKLTWDTSLPAVGIKMFRIIGLKEEEAVQKNIEQSQLVIGIATSGTVRSAIAESIGQTVKDFGHQAVGGQGAFKMGEAHGLILFEIAGLMVGAGEAKQLANLTKLLKAGDTVGASKLIAQTLKANQDNLSAGLKKHININCLNCFTAGTLVLTAQGAKAIEDIEVGDMVWSYDEDTGDVVLKEVTYVHEVTRDTIYEIYISNGEKIEATPDHPFFVHGSWFRVDELSEGDTLKTFEGDDLLVIDSLVLVKGEFPVYNFTVADNHTYYVGQGEILVHNCDVKVDLKSLWSKNDKGIFLNDEFAGTVQHDFGELQFDITVPKNLRRQGVLTKVMKKAVEEFNPTRILGAWKSKYTDGKPSTNYTIFMENLKTMDKYKAALNTPTGRAATKNGFGGKPEVNLNSVEGVKIINVTFKPG